ncbi:SRPBCC domain-containing protein [Marinobacterium sedimentorum]|uniref:SRPBCC domain-containing protein n=1 Tax=Marinobacterium sedimentorum TaxID=2927804 RepID=UPI0020C604AC|nr:SRPBCC domain-containing protein [Marinobacterium sedimentorum]MCP8688304.1 SRPBCC domain-containing protein [Marinobacterium sedimentorum]
MAQAPKAQPATGDLSSFNGARPYLSGLTSREHQSVGAEQIPCRGVFLEVTPGRRFVFTDAFDSHWNPQHAFMVGTFQIEAEGEGTRYRASARHWSQEDLEKHEAMGFTEGWTAVAAQLAALTESMTGKQAEEEVGP